MTHKVSKMELFVALFNGFRLLHSVTMSAVLVVAGVLDLPLHFIINFIIVIINLICTTFFTFITFTSLGLLIKNSLLFLWGMLTVWFCFLICLNWSTRLPFGVDALSLYYNLTSFYYGAMKARDIDRIFDIIWVILCLIVSPVINEK